jgi:hypothetical protein
VKLQFGEKDSFAGIKPLIHKMLLNFDMMNYKIHFLQVVKNDNAFNKEPIG